MKEESIPRQDSGTTGILDSIEAPSDIKTLSLKELKLLAREIRQKIISTVSKNGGHLGGPLGCVELSIALHYVFNSPEDKLVWDVGHQAYAHKLLTGRNKNFHTLRQYNGISGFVKPSESEHDAYGVGHSSTSISAALGMVIARDLKHENYNVIAIIGDGALTAGIAYEALNQAGLLQKNILVILNDNKMSINPNVGAISRYLQQLVVYPRYHELRKRTKELMLKIPKIGEDAVEKTYQFEKKIKKVVMPLTLFEEFGFRYFGPIDGHNIGDLIHAFQNMKDLEGPLLLHIITEKGKGYHFAENDGETRLHGMSPFSIDLGKAEKKEIKPLTFTEAFSQSLCKLSELNEDIVAITPAMKSGSGLTEFARRFPDRFFDVGIAEQHAVSFSGGMAIQGLKPVCALYSTFFQRAYDQFIHDICLQNLPVTFVVDRAGLAGEDGPTHHGTFDIAFMRSIPHITIMAPKDERELFDMLHTSVNTNGPCSIRFPKGSTKSFEIPDTPHKIGIGKSEIIKKGKDIAIFSVGPLADEAIIAATRLEEKGINVSVINARFIKPLDKKAILSFAKKTKKIITIEEGALHGGFGSGVLELLHDNGVSAQVKRLGIPDTFIDHGSLSLLRKKVGLDSDHVEKTAYEMMQS